MLTHRRALVLATRLAMLAILALALLLTTEPARSQVRLAPEFQSMRDLGTPDASGVTQTERFQGPGQVNAYTFSAPPGPSAIHVYVGDLVLRRRRVALAARRPRRGSRRRVGCDRSAGCLASAPPSRRRMIQFIEPKSILEAAEGGSYAVLVRSRDDAGFDPRPAVHPARRGDAARLRRRAGRRRPLLGGPGDRPGLADSVEPDHDGRVRDPAVHRPVRLLLVGLTAPRARRARARRPRCPASACRERRRGQ